MPSQKCLLRWQINQKQLAAISVRELQATESWNVWINIKANVKHWQLLSGPDLFTLRPVVKLLKRNRPHSSFPLSQKPSLLRWIRVALAWVCLKNSFPQTLADAWHSVEFHLNAPVNMRLTCCNKGVPLKNAFKSNFRLVRPHVNGVIVVGRLPSTSWLQSSTLCKRQNLNYIL